MTSPVGFCLLAMAFYALEIAITDWQLSRLEPKLVTFLYAAGVALFAGIRLAIGERTPLPTGRQWLFVALMIVASFLAASAHFQALHERAGAVVLTLSYCLMPVAASVYMALFTGLVPDFRTVAAWLLAAIALALLATAPSRP